jgi:hypothetical protein
VSTELEIDSLPKEKKKKLLEPLNQTMELSLGI